MQAGITGINAIRVYNPSKQFFDHDAEGIFVKQWIPELREHKPVEIAHADEVSLAGYSSPVVCLNKRAKEMKTGFYKYEKVFG